MEIQEYKSKLKQLENSFDIDKKNLAIQYAKENNPYKVGDIVSDSSTTIKIDKIITYLDYNKPCCIYKGCELKKDLTPKKNGDIGSVYQERITISQTF